MDTLRMLYLGNFEAQCGDKALHAFQSEKNQALLGYLAAAPGALHRREQLTGLFWPEKPEAAARHSLSQALYSLRMLLGCAPDEVLLRYDHRAAWLDEGRLWVDACEFDRLVQEAESHRHDPVSACSACLARLEQAAALYRGEFWAGFSLDGCEDFEDWLRQYRERYRQKMVRVCSMLVEEYNHSGALEKALEYARQLTGIDPYDEPGQAQILQLLVKLGRRGEALASYEAYRHLVKEELGIDPGPEIQALHAELLRNAPDASPRAHLPAPLAPLVGRQVELQALLELLHDPETRLVTVVGMGGVGKTRLAIEAGRQAQAAFPGGVYYVNTNTHLPASALLPAIARAVGMEIFSHNPFVASRRSGSLSEQVIETLRERELLLVLDSFERILDASAQVGELLQEAPGLKILATSRAPLALEGEILFPLDGLPYPAQPAGLESARGYASVELFARGAQRSSPGFRLTA